MDLKTIRFLCRLNYSVVKNGEIFGMKLEQCKQPYDSDKTGSSSNFFLALDTRVSIVICHCQTDFDASHLGEV